MKNIILVFLLVAMTMLIVNCATSTKITVKKPVPVPFVITSKTGSDSTVMAYQMTPVYEMEVKEKNMFGISKTSVRDMGDFSVKQGQAQILGAIAGAIDKDPANIRLFETASIPGSNNDGRHIYQNGYGSYGRAGGLNTFNQRFNYWQDKAQIIHRELWGPDGRRRKVLQKNKSNP